MPGGFSMPADHRNQVLNAAQKQVQRLYDESPQAMYLFLDDRNKTCNERFAKMLGYPSAAAWAGVQGSFPDLFVDPASQDKLIATYQDAMQNGKGAHVPITWRRKDGKAAPSRTILVPLDVDGHRLALHFIDPA
jgi:PAS domain-containing protein